MNNRILPHYQLDMQPYVSRQRGYERLPHGWRASIHSALISTSLTYFNFGVGLCYRAQRSRTVADALANCGFSTSCSSRVLCPELSRSFEEPTDKGWSAQSTTLDCPMLSDRFLPNSVLARRTTRLTHYGHAFEVSLKSIKPPATASP
jgi:hypothetical protein